MPLTQYRGNFAANSQNCIQCVVVALTVQARITVLPFLSGFTVHARCFIVRIAHPRCGPLASTASLAGAALARHRRTGRHPGWSSSEPPTPDELRAALLTRRRTSHSAAPSRGAWTLTKKERDTHTPLHFQHIAHWGGCARPGSGRILAGRGQTCGNGVRMPVTDTDVIIVGAAPTASCGR